MIEACVIVSSFHLPVTRYLSGATSGDSPPVALASAQSREHLAGVKQALRALGFNKQVTDLLVLFGQML